MISGVRNLYCMVSRIKIKYILVINYHNKVITTSLDLLPHHFTRTIIKAVYNKCIIIHTQFIYTIRGPSAQTQHQDMYI